MSIKIYTGFILRATTLEGALDKIHVLRRDVKDLARVRMARCMGQKCAARLDRYAARDLFPEGGSIPRLQNPMSDVWMELLDEHREAKAHHRRNLDTDYEFTMTLHPDNGDILGMSFVEEDGWHSHWMQGEGVEDYCYFNNTDRPEALTEAEWEEREGRWNSVLDRDPGCRPAFAGITANIHEGDPPVAKVEDVLDYLPDFEARASKLSFEIMHSHAIARLHADATNELSTSAIVSALYKLQDHVQTEEGRAERDLMISKLGERLAPELTRDILLKGLPE